MTNKKIPGLVDVTSPGARPGPEALPARKPMARATRITLFEREVRERLSRAALDVVFARAESLSEGNPATIWLRARSTVFSSRPV